MAQSLVDVSTSEARLLRNKEVHEDFDEDNHHNGPASNRPPLSFCVVVYCHVGYMLILHLRDETYVKLMDRKSFVSIKFCNF